MKLTLQMLFVLAIFSYDCSDKMRETGRDFDIVNKTDPYLSAFWDKGIRYVLEENFGGGYDTTAFDSLGNRQYIRTVTRSERFNYNDFRFITRYFSNRHIYENYVIEYSFEGDSIIQVWKKLPHLDWHFDDADLDSTSDYMIVLILDSIKRVSMEYDTMRQQTTTYLYSDSLLVGKECRSSADNRVLTKEVYRYDNSVLTVVEVYSGDELAYTYFYAKNGLPRLKRRSLKGFPDYDLKFHYVYY
jgi:hypothetical protein